MRNLLWTLPKLLGSNALTLALIVASAAVALAGEFAGLRVADWMALPAAGLAVNLFAALATNAKLRSRSLLFGFHVLLAIMAALVSADRLTAMSGRVEVLEGAMFDPALVEAEVGPLHDWGLDRVAFLQGSFEIFYAPGMKRRETISKVRTPDGQGSWTDHEIGDDHPLVAGPYRFYTTFNKGFAPVLRFTGRDGVESLGAVHLPSYPLNEHNQANEWTPPGESAPLKLWLHAPEPVFDESKAWRFGKPANARLVVIEGEERHELALGAGVRLKAGLLRYEDLRSWMGYSIEGHTLTPWIVAAAMLAVAALLSHLAGALSAGWDGALRRPEASGDVV